MDLDDRRMDVGLHVGARGDDGDDDNGDDADEDDGDDDGDDHRDCRDDDDEDASGDDDGEDDGAQLFGADAGAEDASDDDDLMLLLLPRPRDYLHRHRLPNISVPGGCLLRFFLGRGLPPPGASTFSMAETGPPLVWHLGGLVCATVSVLFLPPPSGLRHLRDDERPRWLRAGTAGPSEDAHGEGAAVGIGEFARGLVRPQPSAFRLVARPAPDVKGPPGSVPHAQHAAGSRDCRAAVSGMPRARLRAGVQGLGEAKSSVPCGGAG